MEPKRTFTLAITVVEISFLFFLLEIVVDLDSLFFFSLFCSVQFAFAIAVAANTTVLTRTTLHTKVAGADACLDICEWTLGIVVGSDAPLKVVLVQLGGALVHVACSMIVTGKIASHSLFAAIALVVGLALQMPPLRSGIGIADAAIETLEIALVLTGLSTKPWRTRAGWMLIFLKLASSTIFDN